MRQSLPVAVPSENARACGGSTAALAVLPRRVRSSGKQARGKSRLGVAHYEDAVGDSGEDLTSVRSTSRVRPTADHLPHDHREVHSQTKTVDLWLDNDANPETGNDLTRGRRCGVHLRRGCRYAPPGNPFCASSPRKRLPRHLDPRRLECCVRRRLLVFRSTAAGAIFAMGPERPRDTDEVTSMPSSTGTCQSGLRAERRPSSFSLALG